MGDGIREFSTDESSAFDLQERTNNASRIPVTIPNTSCRIASFDTLENELKNSSFTILKSGITHSLPDFNSLMYAVICKER